MEERMKKDKDKREEKGEGKRGVEGKGY